MELAPVELTIMELAIIDIDEGEEEAGGGG